MLLAKTELDAALVEALREFNIRTVEQFVSIEDNGMKKRSLLQVIDIDEAQLDKEIRALAKRFPSASRRAVTPARRYGMGYRVNR